MVKSDIIPASKVIKICQNPECGKTHLVHKVDDNRGRGKFCSQICYINFMKEEKGKRQSQYELQNKKCLNCNKKISYEKRENNFCDHRCKSIFYNKQRPTRREK